MPLRRLRWTSAGDTLDFMDNLIDDALARNETRSIKNKRLRRRARCLDIEESEVEADSVRSPAVQCDKAGGAQADPVSCAQDTPISSGSNTTSEAVLERRDRFDKDFVRLIRREPAPKKRNYVPKTAVTNHNPKNAWTYLESLTGSKSSMQQDSDHKKLLSPHGDRKLASLPPSIEAILRAKDPAKVFATSIGDYEHTTDRSDEDDITDICGEAVKEADVTKPIDIKKTDLYRRLQHLKPRTKFDTTSTRLPFANVKDLLGSSPPKPLKKQVLRQKAIPRKRRAAQDIEDLEAEPISDYEKEFSSDASVRRIVGSWDRDSLHGSESGSKSSGDEST